METWRRKSDGKLADVKPIDPNKGRRSALIRTGFLRVRLQGQKGWNTLHPGHLAEHFERVENGE